jgi:hypothetical protein
VMTVYSLFWKILVYTKKTHQQKLLWKWRNQVPLHSKVHHANCNDDCGSSPLHFTMGSLCLIVVTLPISLPAH